MFLSFLFPNILSFLVKICDVMEKYISVLHNHLWFGFWCLMALSTIFQLYPDGQFYWWMKPEVQELLMYIKLDIYVFITKLPTHREMIILVGIYSVNQKSDTDELQESFRLLV
jgi:hypothetical protein